MVAGRLVGGSGSSGPALDVGIATPTSAPGGRGRRWAGRPVPRTGAGVRCRSTRSAQMVMGGECVRSRPPRSGRRGRTSQGWSTDTRSASTGPDAGLGRQGPCRSGSAPRPSSDAQRPGPGCPAARDGASSNGRRPARRLQMTADQQPVPPRLTTRIRLGGRRIRAHARRRHRSGGSRRSRFVNRTSSTSSRSCSTAPPRDTLGWGARVSPHPSSTASRAHGQHPHITSHRARGPRDDPRSASRDRLSDGAHAATANPFFRWGRTISLSTALSGGGCAGAGHSDRPTLAPSVRRVP